MAYTNSHLTSTHILWDAGAVLELAELYAVLSPFWKPYWRERPWRHGASEAEVVVIHLEQSFRLLQKLLCHHGRQPGIILGPVSACSIAKNRIEEGAVWPSLQNVQDLFINEEMWNCVTEKKQVTAENSSKYSTLQRHTEFLLISLVCVCKGNTGG